MSLAAIEDAFVALAQAIPGVGYVSKNTPLEAPARLPAVMLLLTQMPTDDFQVTGPLAQVTWTWSVIVWVKLADQQDAQEDAKLFLPLVLGLPRKNRSLSDTVEYWSVSDDGDEPDFDYEKGVYEKRLRMTATAEETWTP